MSDPVDDSKRSHDALVTVEQADGTKWVVGHAKINIENGAVFADVNLNADSVIRHVFNRDISRFSISTGVISPSVDAIRSLEPQSPLPVFKKRMSVEDWAEGREIAAMFDGLFTEFIKDERVHDYVDRKLAEEKTQKVLNDYNDLLNNEQIIKDAFKRAEEE